MKDTLYSSPRVYGNIYEGEVEGFKSKVVALSVIASKCNGWVAEVIEAAIKTCR